MNFYDEAIEAKHQLRQEIAQRQKLFRETLRLEAVKNIATPKLAVAATYGYDIDALDDADPYFWEPRLTQLVLASGQQLPSTTRFDASWLRGRAGYWWFGHSSPLIGVSEGERQYVVALLWKLNSDNSVSVTTYRIDGREQFVLGSLTWSENKTLAQAMLEAEDVEMALRTTPDIAIRELAVQLHENLANLSANLVELDEDVIEKHQEVMRIRAEMVKNGLKPRGDNYDLTELRTNWKRHLETAKQDITKTDEAIAERGKYLAQWTTASKNALVTFACGSLWLNQKIVVATQAPLSRGAQRRLARQKIDPKCLVVELRSKQYTGGSSDSHSSVDWAWQWAVRGHWRDQPTKEGTKLIWIHPYIKGPEDKPLKADVARVFAVRR